MGPWWATTRPGPGPAARLSPATTTWGEGETVSEPLTTSQHSGATTLTTGSDPAASQGPGSSTLTRATTGTTLAPPTGGPTVTTTAWTFRPPSTTRPAV